MQPIKNHQKIMESSKEGSSMNPTVTLKDNPPNTDPIPNFKVFILRHRVYLFVAIGTVLLCLGLFFIPIWDYFFYSGLGITYINFSITSKMINSSLTMSFPG
eukprot:TRINITY_DN822_c0_g2_i4.p4 TRINITY_DN822_c0_g2~~TRINITY_DN822_c0_g2_i4.p4  ORF type:complete len:102 (+),score=24.38 TRINITY_DN822_c0_g2_i4:96-401(+)